MSRVKISLERGQALADVRVGVDVIVELVKDLPQGAWEVWSVRIDGTRYREPRDLCGDPLGPGPFKDSLDEALERARGS